MLHRNRFPVGRRPVGRSAGVVAVLALFLLGACGVEAGDDTAAVADTTDTTAATAEAGSDADDGPAGTDGGNDPGNAGGTAGTDDGGDPSGDDEPTTTPDSTPGGSEDDMVRDALIEGLESAGLTTEQATCLADGYIELGITDPETAGDDMDVMGMMEMFTECGISLEDLGNLGTGLST